MIELWVPPYSILEREIGLPVFLKEFDPKVFPAISVFYMDKDHVFKTAKGRGYVCLDGHKRLATAKVLHFAEVRIRVPEGIEDFLQIVQEANLDPDFIPLASLEENRRAILDPENILECQRDPHNVRNLRHDYILARGFKDPYF